jgi:hypothetical protein
MDAFIHAFRRAADGSWTCVAPTTFDGLNGRMQVAPGTRLTPGTSFMGVDLARWLDSRARDATPAPGDRQSVQDPGKQEAPAGRRFPPA